MNKTIIIPAKNAAWCLPECLESIGQQTERPNRVLIGSDACPESMATALELKAEYIKQSRKRHRFIVDVYHFPRHVGPFLIRNTLALLAPPGALLFFDADDLMQSEFVAKMTSGLQSDRFINARAVMREDSNECQWDRAHGINAIMRDTFIKHGGFRGWLCGADSEAQLRWEAGGLQRYVTAEPVMIVRKHADGLTRAKDTGYSSSLRKAYKREIEVARRDPKRCGAIAIADFVPVEQGDSEPTDERQRQAGCHIQPEPSDDIRKNTPTPPEETEMHLRRMLAVVDKPLEHKQRQVFNQAATHVAELQQKRK